MGVLTVEATSETPRLVFADKFVQVFKETNEDNQERPGNPNEEEPGAKGHCGAGQSDHKSIVNQARDDRPWPAI